MKHILKPRFEKIKKIKICKKITKFWGVKSGDFSWFFVIFWQKISQSCGGYPPRNFFLKKTRWSQEFPEKKFLWAQNFRPEFYKKCTKKWPILHPEKKLVFYEGSLSLRNRNFTKNTLFFLKFREKSGLTFSWFFVLFYEKCLSLKIIFRAKKCPKITKNARKFLGISGFSRARKNVHFFTQKNVQNFARFFSNFCETHLKDSIFKKWKKVQKKFQKNRIFRNFPILQKIAILHKFFSGGFFKNFEKKIFCKWKNFYKKSRKIQFSANFAKKWIFGIPT